jgi:hypothetical protein
MKAYLGLVALSTCALAGFWKFDLAAKSLDSQNRLGGNGHIAASLPWG